MDWVFQSNCAREDTQNKSAKPLNCILVWLDGGSSHYESFDSKLEKVSGGEEAL